ncbi:MAG: toll/interleukin-1 receptor domain-containing protein [Acidimicrobiia bacterium]|nr:toll/interleukin-1 receptor domain-containing protein [Acidimicrobiia bacterium]
MPPKVFLSHSCLDKTRFTTCFAEQLQAKGVDVWYDDWALRPGDSLVDRVFEHELDDADVFIVVLSANSIDSKWVKEELNNAFIRKIEGQCKIIPVVLDGVEVPAVLRDTLYQEIANCDSYDNELQRILEGIFNLQTKPLLGQPPAYVHAVTGQNVNGSTPAEVFVLRQMVELRLADPEVLMSTSHFKQIQKDGELTEHQINKELSRLHKNDYLEQQRGLPITNSCRLTPHGFIEALRKFDIDVKSAKQQIVVFMTNAMQDEKTQLQSVQIADGTGQPIALVRAFLQIWEREELIKMTRTFGHDGYNVWQLDALFEEEST